MHKRDIPIAKEDYITILKQGGRVEKIYGTCNQNNFLQDIKPFVEDLKVAKGVILQITLPKNIKKDSVDVYNYFKEIINYSQDSCIFVTGLYFDEGIEENKLSYKILMSGITFKLKKNDERNQIITEKDKEELRAFNKRLIKVQENISKEAIKLDEQLKLRVDNENDSMIDYEIDLELSFYLKDDDPEYRDDDCIISTIKYRLKDISSEKEHFEDILDTSINHYDYFKKDDLADISKSWLFFKLRYHDEISWQDMLRIGTIWTDINVSYQYWDKYNLENK